MILDTKAVVLIVAMLCITIMESIAMTNGINGTAFAGAVGAVVTIAGYLFRQKEKE